MQGDIITYDYYDSLYINLTNRCDCRCVFCIRDQEDAALGGLWLQEEPAKEDVLAEILGRDLSGYADANAISAYAKQAMAWANGQGLITGVTATTLRPDGNAVRAQAATILCLLYTSDAADEL